MQTGRGNILRTEAEWEEKERPFCGKRCIQRPGRRRETGENDRFENMKGLTSGPRRNGQPFRDGLSACVPSGRKREGPRGRHGRAGSIPLPTALQKPECPYLVPSFCHLSQVRKTGEQQRATRDPEKSSTGRRHILASRKTERSTRDGTTNLPAQAPWSGLAGPCMQWKSEGTSRA